MYWKRTRAILDSSLTVIILKALDVIFKRRSVRKYNNRRVPSRLVHMVLEAAMSAPSAHNAQPWRFIVLDNTQDRRRLATAMAKRYEIDLKKDGISPKTREEIVETSKARFASAPILIIVCLTMKNMHRYSDRERQETEYKMAVQSVAAAVQNILLTAFAQGLGACWYCAPLFCQQAVRDGLRLTPDIEPQALITMGYPDENPNAPPRLAFEETVSYDYWKLIK